MPQEVLSIKIGVNDEKEVTYENTPDIDRTLFPNITEASSAEVEELSEKVDELESAISSLGEGIPSGGTTGQLLGKKSNTDYDVEWESVHDVPSGGTTGQVLKKKTDTDYDVEWGNDNTGHDVPSGGTTGQVLKKTNNNNYAVEWGNESGGVMWVTFTTNGNTHQADKTFSEIMTAVNDGLIVIGKNTSGSIFNLYTYTSSYAMFMYSNDTAQYYTLSAWYTIQSNGTVQYNTRTGDFYPGNQDKTLYLAIDHGSSILSYYSYNDVSDFYYDLYDTDYGYVCKPMAVLNEVTEHVVLDDDAYYDFVRYYLASFTTTGYPAEAVSTLVFKSPGSNATITVEAPWYDYWANATVTKTT